MEGTLFQGIDDGVSSEENLKSYRAIRHDVVRKRQRDNSDSAHHPKQKENQILRCVGEMDKYLSHDIKILELFAGRGNMTKVYKSLQKATVHAYDKTYLKTKDSYTVYHSLIGIGEVYDIIDLDPYGFPNRLFPDIFLLINDGLMFITMPKPYVNVLNGITATHLTAYYGTPNPSKEVIINRIAMWGLCHWRQVELIDEIDLGRLYRFCFKITKVKATDYTGVRNR